MDRPFPDPVPRHRDGRFARALVGVTAHRHEPLACSHFSGRAAERRRLRARSPPPSYSPPSGRAIAGSRPPGGPPCISYARELEDVSALACWSLLGPPPQAKSDAGAADCVPAWIRRRSSLETWTRSATARRHVRALWDNHRVLLRRRRRPVPLLSICAAPQRLNRDRRRARCPSPPALPSLAPSR